jgi:hypothetical protein
MMQVFDAITPEIMERVWNLLSGMSPAKEGRSQAHMDVLVAVPERRFHTCSNSRIISLIKQENPAPRRGFRDCGKRISPEA